MRRRWTAVAVALVVGGMTPAAPAAAVTGAVPVGQLEAVTSAPGPDAVQLSVRGWTADPDAPTTSVEYAVDVEGTTVSGRFIASVDRPDVASAYPAFGAAHGFAATVPVAVPEPGRYQVCVRAWDVPSGAATTIGCTTVRLLGGVTFGNIDHIVVGPSVTTVTGWSIDPDTTASGWVSLASPSTGAADTASTRPAGAIRADATRPDVAAAFPGYGAAHGWTLTTPTRPGIWSFCVTGWSATRADGLLGCRTVTGSSRSPVGSLDRVTGNAGYLTVAGWALDPDTTESIQYWIDFGGGARLYDVYASSYREDVDRFFPGYGGDHAFSFDLVTGLGPQTACVMAVNVGAGTNTSLGCGTVTVTDPSPRGNIESAVAEQGGIRVKGWAFDPNTPESGYVWMDVDGGSGRPVYAADPRPDVQAAFPGQGPRHGFSTLIAAGPGRHVVCVTAINSGVGLAVGKPFDRSLGCSTVVVPDTSSPVGNLESATGVPGGVNLRGWALDPDTNESPYVWVTVDGGGGRYVRATAPRPDVANIFPGRGDAYGFASTVPAGRGAHVVCLTISNVGPGWHTTLGCRAVNVP